MHESAVASVPIPASPSGWDIAAIRLYRVAGGFNDGTTAAADMPSAYLLVTELLPQVQTFTVA